MIIKSAEFVTSAAKPHQYPSGALPEIAFAGRSNVGKSSCINTLLNRKKLVKTSNSPGRTQLVNFFEINRAFYFVDLPGFGYAKVPLRVKRSWKPMVEAYFSNRYYLYGVVLIMDIRRGPGLEENNLIKWLAGFNLSVISVFTKADKLSKAKQIRQNASFSKILRANPDDSIIFSSKTRQGREEVWKAIEKLLP